MKCKKENILINLLHITIEPLIRVIMFIFIERMLKILFLFSSLCVFAVHSFQADQRVY